MSPGIPAADTDVGEARTAPREEGEEGLLLWGGLCDRNEEHCPGGMEEEFMRVEKVMKRGKLWGIDNKS